MLQYRPLQYALLVSLAIHAVVLTVFSINHWKNMVPIQPKIEVTYAVPKQKKILPAPQIQNKDVTNYKEKKLTDDLDILSKKSDFSSTLHQEIKGADKSNDKIQLGRKEAPSVRSFQDSNRIITVPLLKSEKITNPKYLSYTDSISQKILQTARRYYNGKEIGKVTLGFMLDNKGNSRDVKVLVNRTNASEYLQQLALRSFKESNPFPPFPKDLNYPELSFNIEISFQEKN